MQIGLDIEERNISVVLLNENKILGMRSQSIYADRKRDANKLIVDKILNLIHDLATPSVQALGISLPSIYDGKKGVVYDIRKIPYWKKAKIKQILSEEFNVPVCINNDVNCFILGEKFHGAHKRLNNSLCIILDEKVRVGLITKGKLYSDQQASFSDIKCLSEAHYEYVRLYKQSYRRTMDELQLICDDFSEEWLCMPNSRVWEDIGNLLGRLISILLMNYDFNTIVLGGRLSYSLVNFSESMYRYWEASLPASVIMDMVISISQVRNPKPIGACYIESYQKILKSSFKSIGNIS